MIISQSEAKIHHFGRIPGTCLEFQGRHSHGYLPVRMLAPARKCKKVS